MHFLLKKGKADSSQAVGRIARFDLSLQSTGITRAPHQADYCRQELVQIHQAPNFQGPPCIITAKIQDIWPKNFQEGRC